MRTTKLATLALGLGLTACAGAGGPSAGAATMPTAGRADTGTNESYAKPGIFDAPGSSGDVSGDPGAF